MSAPDEFDGIFDDLTIADFERDTSAVTEIGRGAGAFDQFVEEKLRAVRTAWITADTFMQPLAIVANRQVERVFIPDHDETLRQFVNRVHREAKAVDAVWTFVAKRSMVASLGAAREDTDIDIDVHDEEAWEQAVAAELIRLGCTWYAEQREGDQRQMRHGHMEDESGTLGELHEGASNQPNALYEAILAD